VAARRSAGLCASAYDVVSTTGDRQAAARNSARGMCTWTRVDRVVLESYAVAAVSTTLTSWSQAILVLDLPSEPTSVVRSPCGPAIHQTIRAAAQQLERRITCCAMFVKCSAELQPATSSQPDRTPAALPLHLGFSPIFRKWAV
jgi:hypothetical protein